ncbi:MAG: hypothetical protein ACFFEF_10950 [Candidatus Thorarchaeota archaeon]
MSKERFYWTGGESISISLLEPNPFFANRGIQKTRDVRDSYALNETLEMEINMTRSRGRLIAAVLLFIVGLVVFLDDLHDFIPGFAWLHWMPEFNPIIIFGFHLQHLYIGGLIMLIALILAAYA